MNFILILMLLASLQFGSADKPRLRRAPQLGTQHSALGTQTVPPHCTLDENGELTCNAADQADKFNR